MEGSTIVNRTTTASASPAPSVASSYSGPIYPSPFPARSKRGFRSVLAGFHTRSKSAKYTPAFFFFMLGVAATLLVSHNTGKWSFLPQIQSQRAAVLPTLSKVLPAGSTLLARQQKEEPIGGVFVNEAGRVSRRMGVTEQLGAEDRPGGGGRTGTRPSRVAEVVPDASPEETRDGDGARAAGPEAAAQGAPDGATPESGPLEVDGSKEEEASPEAASNASSASGGEPPAPSVSSEAAAADGAGETTSPNESREEPGSTKRSSGEGTSGATDRSAEESAGGSGRGTEDVQAGGQRSESNSGGGGAGDGRAAGAGSEEKEPTTSRPPEPELSLAVFTAPRPYTGESADPQRRALLSWLGLRGFRVRVYLFGDHPSFHQLAAEFPGAVAVERHVDASFYGVPQLHSMLARAALGGANLTLLAAADTVLLGRPFGAVVAKAAAQWGLFAVTGVSWDVDSEPASHTLTRPAPRQGVEQSGAAGRALLSGPLPEVPGTGFLPDFGPGEEADEEEKTAAHVAASGQMHTHGGDGVLWLWNGPAGGGVSPLVEGPVPPFAFGRGGAEGWLTAALVEQGRRQVVDATGAVFAFRPKPPAQKGDVKHLLQSARPAERRCLWALRRPQPWEVFANARLAEGPSGVGTAGSMSHLHAPWRLIPCYEPAAGGLCLVKRTRPGNCSCELSPYAASTQTDARPNGKYFACGTVPPVRSGPVAVPSVPAEGSPHGLPHRVHDLLPFVANEQKVVVMVGVNMPYAEMLMNFVCRLRQLGMPDVLVAALDADLYKFAFLEGLAVYFEPLASSIAGVDQKQCHYGSDCFKKLTKLKSRAVVRVLRLGFHVLWTDVDIVWFRNPLPELLAFGPGTLPVQSNEYNTSRPANRHHCINSGFYFARSEPVVIKAFEAVIEHAAKSKGSEQPSFYEVLCGSYGKYKRGTDECFWPLHGGLRVAFLPRDLHPNGLWKLLWGRGNVTQACEALGCATLHNNWIIGKAQKEKRMHAKGFWSYDAASHLCSYDWTPRPSAAG